VGLGPLRRHRRRGQENFVPWGRRKFTKSATSRPHPPGRPPTDLRALLVGELAANTWIVSIQNCLIDMFLW
jgi:hypothetical protein